MDYSSLTPEQQQQVAAQYLQQNPPPPPPPPPPSTLNMTVHDLQNIIQTVSAKTLETLHSTREADSTSVLPKHIRSLQKPKQFDCKETSGKFRNWQRDIANFIKLQCLDPKKSPQHNEQCRAVVEMNCVGQALAHVQRLSVVTPRPHFFWTFEGLISALQARFTYPEEDEQARRALDALRMCNKTSARTYCTQFESLLDDVVHMSDSDVMYAFTKGLQPRLKEWVLHDRPETLQAAIEIVVRMSGSDESHTSAPSKQTSSSSPMDVDRIVAALSRLEMGNTPHNFTKNNNYNKSYRTPYDPRRDS